MTIRTLENVSLPPSLKQIAFKAIKTAIMTNKIVPGQLYSTQQLAKELGISETPVRDSLLELEQKGFLNLLPRKGVLIQTINNEKIHNVYEVRNILETAIVSKVTLTLKEADIQSIQNIHQKAQKFAASKQTSSQDERLDYLKHDRDFHGFLAKLTGNPHLTNALEDIRDLIDWISSKALARSERMREVQQEHEEVLTAIVRRDAKRAAALMADHIRITEEKVLEWYRAKGTL